MCYCKKHTFILFCTESPSTHITRYIIKSYAYDVWALWYSLGLTETQYQRLKVKLDKLIQSSTTEKEWSQSKFGQHLHFSDEATRHTCRKVSSCFLSLLSVPFLFMPSSSSFFSLLCLSSFLPLYSLPFSSFLLCSLFSFPSFYFGHLKNIDMGILEGERDTSF